MQQQQINIDVSDYIASKAQGLARIVKLEGVAYYSKRAFNPATGQPVPVLVPMDAAQVQTALDQAQAQVRTFQEILADIAGAEEKISVPEAGN